MYTVGITHYNITDTVCTTYAVTIETVHIVSKNTSNADHGGLYI